MYANRLLNITSISNNPAQFFMLIWYARHVKLLNKPTMRIF